MQPHSAKSKEEALKRGSKGFYSFLNGPEVFRSSEGSDKVSAKKTEKFRFCGKRGNERFQAAHEKPPSGEKRRRLKGN